jgi:NO-binding membrane sensor protein with MHYT domain
VCTALVGWRVERRIRLRGVAVYLLGLGVLGAVNDYTGKAALDASAIITFAPGLAPVLADVLCSGTNALMALLAMRLLSGPAAADHLTGAAKPAPTQG